MAPEGSRQRIVFGTTINATEHAFRHIDACGLNRNQVMQAILSDLESRLPLQVAASGAPVQGSVVVGELRLRYHAYPLAGDIINVGRITPS
jgi:hypothetical protein